jgi:hypothetical protein
MTMESIILRVPLASFGSLWPWHTCRFDEHQMESTLLAHTTHLSKSRSVESDPSEILHQARQPSRTSVVLRRPPGPLQGTL